MLKKIFIPGWMDTADNHVDFDGLEIWKKKCDIGEPLDYEYVVGHSLGANFALLNWKRNKNTKLVLINPLLSRKNIFYWMLCDILTGSGPINKKRLSTFLHPIIAVGLCLKLLSEDLLALIEKIPQDKIIFVRGEKDRYFFDMKTAEYLRKKGFKIKEIGSAGHSWNKKYNEAINSIVN
jgi:hypothetical protein